MSGLEVYDWSEVDQSDPVPYSTPAARAGVDLTPQAWGAAYVEHYTRTKIGPLDSLVIHHTATGYPGSADALPAMLRQLEAYGHSRDGADIEYHALIAHGLVAEGYAPRHRGCHCVQSDPRGGSYNQTSLGVALIGYYYPPTNDPRRPADLDALARWVAARVVDGDLTASVFYRAEKPGRPGWYGHQTTGAATACPGQVLEWLPETMDHARQLYETGGAPDMTDDQAYQLQSIFQQLLTPYEPGSTSEGLTPRWQWQQPLTDADVERIAQRTAELLAG